MNTMEILTALDTEIARLRQVRELLAGAEQSARRKPGRPKGSAGKTASESEGTPAKKRVLSPEARERIAAAQRARWAAHSAATAAGEGGAKRGRPAKKSGRGDKASAVAKRAGGKGGRGGRGDGADSAEVASTAE